MPYNINKIASECLKDCVFPMAGKEYNSVYNNEDFYHKSFSNIKKFSKTVKSSVKKSINCVVFNKQNSDGIMATWVTLHYLKSKNNKNNNSNNKNNNSNNKNNNNSGNKNNNNSNVVLIPVGAGRGEGVDFQLKKNEDKLKDKFFLVVDLAYNKESLKFLKKHAKTLIVIDDHSISKNLANNSNFNSNSIFVGDESHSACAYAWKFFYPKKKVPHIVQLVDSDDRKLFLKHIGNTIPFRTFFNYRYIHSPYLKWHDHRSFEKLDSFINQTNINLTKFIGHYYDELANNLKEQASRNAAFGYFEGHPVMLLCYNDPALTSMILRQMLSNAEKMGKKVHFAVTWGWEHSNNCYNIQLCEKHIGSPKIIYIKLLLN